MNKKLQVCIKNQFLFNTILMILFCHFIIIARPADKATIEYFINIGNVLSDDMDNGTNNKNNTDDTENVLETICSTLGMSEDQLTANIGKTILSTARQVIGCKYPDPETIFGKIEKGHIQAVIGEFFMLFVLSMRHFFTLEFAWHMHPLEKKSNDAAKLRHAMGNVFASRKFLRKLKLGGQ